MHGICETHISHHIHSKIPHCACISPAAASHSLTGPTAL